MASPSVLRRLSFGEDRRVLTSHDFTKLKNSPTDEISVGVFMPLKCDNPYRYKFQFSYILMIANRIRRSYQRRPSAPRLTVSPRFFAAGKARHALGALCRKGWVFPEGRVSLPNSRSLVRFCRHRNERKE